MALIVTDALKFRESENDQFRRLSLSANFNTPVPVSQGGTGADNAADAITNLGFESGANYCKLPDGTIMQWGETTLNVEDALTQIGTSGIYAGFAVLRFPQSFVGTYSINGMVRYSTGYEVPCGFLYNNYGNRANVRIYDFFARPASSTLYVCKWTAIGRWK